MSAMAFRLHSHRSPPVSMSMRLFRSWVSGFLLIYAAVFAILALLPWKAGTHLLPGEARDEQRQLKYVFAVTPMVVGGDATPDQRYWVIHPEDAPAFARVARVTGHGVEVSNVEVTASPGVVKWSSGNKKTTSAEGLIFDVRYRVQAPADVAASGTAWVEFDAEGFQAVLPNSLALAKNRARLQTPRAFRTVYVHPDSGRKLAAQMQMQAILALPFAFVIHGIIRIVLSVRATRRADAFTGPALPTFPQTFAPNDAWSGFLPAIFQSAFSAAGIALAVIAFIEEDVATALMVIPYIAGGTLLVVAITWWFCRRALRRVEVRKEGITIARGKSGPELAQLRWEEIEKIEERNRTHKGQTTYWLAIHQAGRRKPYTITKGLVQNYPVLRDLLFSVQTARAHLGGTPT
jgi:hypothetical protein